MTTITRKSIRKLTYLKEYNCKCYLNKNQFSAITIASELVYKHKQKNGTIESYLSRINYGVAFASPKDKYDKIIGRNLAIERLDEKQSIYRGTIKIKKQFNPVNSHRNKINSVIILHAIISDILLNIHYPEDCYNVLMQNLYIE